MIKPLENDDTQMEIAMKKGQLFDEISEDEVSESKEDSEEDDDDCPLTERELNDWRDKQATSALKSEIKKLIDDGKLFLYLRAKNAKELAGELKHRGIDKD